MEKEDPEKVDTSIVEGVCTVSVGGFCVKSVVEPCGESVLGGCCIVRELSLSLFLFLFLFLFLLFLLFLFLLFFERSSSLCCFASSSAIIQCPKKGDKRDETTHS